MLTAIIIILLCAIAVLLAIIALRHPKDPAPDIQNAVGTCVEAALKSAEERHQMEMRDFQERTRLQFKELAGEALRDNSEQLRLRGSQELDAVLGPFREKLEGLRKVVTESYVQENASRRSLSDQVERLMALNRTIGDEARNLTHALKRDPGEQGRWGETVLENLLESAGMRRGSDYEVQVTRDSTGHTLRDQEGRLQRPDVIVKLPDAHRIVIDSKVSLTAYLDYTKAGDDDERREATRRHTASVRSHVDELASKQYHLTIEGALEHTLMFMPNEGAYLAAVDSDPELWNYAYDRKVVIVSPAHLFSVMQIISQLWRQEKQNLNAEKIARLGGELYDKLTRFASEFVKIEKELDDVRKAYDKAYNHLATGRGNVIRRAQQLRDKGARVGASLPSQLLLDDEVPEEEDDSD